MVERGPRQGQVTRYRYNAQNQLVEVNVAGVITRYAYDALGRRISKSTEQGTTTFYWNGDVLLGEINEGVSNTSSDGSTKPSRSYLFEPLSFKPLALVQHGQVYHYHTDHIGTPREITNAKAEVVWSSTFKTYGALALAHVNEVDNPLRFQGQYYDEETGLHYNRHRYYDPNSGQFTTQDPIGLLGGMNVYQYAPNPMTWVDPWGLSCKDGGGVSGKYGPHEEGPLGDPNDPRSKASTFRSGTYTEKVSDGNVTVYRDHGGKASADGRFWTPEPSAGPLQSQLDSAVLPEWGNTFENQSKMTLPEGTVYYEGPAAPQTGTVGMRPQLMGGGIQIYVPKVDARLIKPNVP
nr:RHS repeat-associated core domain-containing protein [Limnobacter sp. SAORIC-690]